MLKQALNLKKGRRKISSSLSLKEYPYLLSGIESFPTVIIRMIAAIKLTAHAIIAARTEESKPV